MNSELRADLRADLVVIEFGKGGKTLAATLGARGRRVVLVEQSPMMYGGTCINTGCVPTKSMVYQGERLAGEPGPAAAAYSLAVANTENLTAGLRAANRAMFDSIPTATVLTGRARFLDSHTVEVSTGSSTVTVSGDAIVVGTGSEAVVSDIPGLRDCPASVTSEQLLHRVARPNRLVVLGGGFIGLEFASMYASYGSAVTVIEHKSAVLGDEDDDVAAAALDLMAKRGITIVTSADIVDVETVSRAGRPPAAKVSYTVAGETATVDADTVLVALGRRANTAGLDLSRAGVKTNQVGAIVVDEFRRTSQSHIFAVGDVNGGPQFTYISLDDYRIVLDQLTAAPSPRSAADRDAVPSCLFLTPPLARVGLTEQQARTTGQRVKVAASPVVNLATVARARIVGETEGMMKVVADADTDQILGAAMLCYDAHEVINLVAMAMRHNISATSLRDGIYTHPSMSEAFNQLLGQLR